MMNRHTTISDQLSQMKDCKVNLYQMTEDDIAQSQSTTATEKEPVSEWMDCRVEADIDGDYTEILTVTVEDLSTLGFQVINNELTYDNVQPDDGGDLKVVVKKEQESNLLSKALKKIRCAVCCQTFLHQRVWKSHLRSAHNGLKTYSCTKCHFKLQDDKTAPSKMAGRHRWILRHIRSHYSLRTHHCTYCVKCFSRNVLLKCHIANSCVARKEVNNGHKCSICRHSFHTLGQWLRHRYAHMRDINRLKYEVNPLTLLKKTKKNKKAKPGKVLKKRKLSKAVPTTWYDEEAPELEHNSVVQIKHEVDSSALSEEEDATLYSCVVCGVNFSNITSLYDHINTHDKEGLSCCHICGEWFKTVSACNSHIATHTANTQKHECNICGATFRSLKNLKTHYLRHQIKVHSCVNCNETFATQQLLKKHRHDKHSAQKYICMECGQEFNRKTFLKQHELREHSAHRHKQICPICGHLWKFDYHVKDHLVACAKEFEMDAEGKKKLEGNLHAKCHTCKQTFPTLAELLSHISVHSKFDASYKCTTCPTAFVCYQDLMLHLAEHKEKPHRCVKCLEMFAEQQLLDDHTCVEYLNNYLESKPHCCDICLLRFVTRSGLHKHCRQKHNQKVQRIYPKRMGRREDSSEGPLKCLYCSETFYTQSTFRVHVNKKHNSRLMYACDLCPRRFDTQALLQFHLVQVHAELKLYRCSTCANAYDSIHLLKQHLTSHPPGEERNQCECAFCGRRCPYPSILERHMRSHNNEKTETCTKCGKAFRDKHTLFYHMAIHNDQYAYVCKLCSKAFKSRASLYTHMQTHNSVRPKCTVCHKTFSTKYTLREHMVVHTREYARVCVICGRGFVYESLYESHLLQHVARGEGDTNTKIGAQNDSDILTVRNDNVLNDEDLSKAMETDDSVVCVLSLQDSMSYEKIIITNGEAGDERTDVVERPNSNVENIPANLEYDLGSLELTAMQE